MNMGIIDILIGLGLLAQLIYFHATGQTAEVYGRWRFGVEIFAGILIAWGMFLIYG